MCMSFSSGDVRVQLIATWPQYETKFCIINVQVRVAQLNHLIQHCSFQVYPQCMRFK